MIFPGQGLCMMTHPPIMVT